MLGEKLSGLQSYQANRAWRMSTVKKRTMYPKCPGLAPTLLLSVFQFQYAFLALRSGRPLPPECCTIRESGDRTKFAAKCTNPAGFRSSENMSWKNDRE